MLKERETVSENRVGPCLFWKLKPQWTEIYCFLKSMVGSYFLLQVRRGAFGPWEGLAHLPAVGLGRMDEEALTLTSGHPDCVPLLICNYRCTFPPKVESLLLRIIATVMENQVKLFSSLLLDLKLSIPCIVCFSTFKGYWSTLKDEDGSNPEAVRIFTFLIAPQYCTKSVFLVTVVLNWMVPQVSRVTWKIEK